MVITKRSLYDFVKKNRISKTTFIFYCIAIALIIYFMMVSIFGDKGLIEYYQLKNQARNIEIEKASLNNKIRVKRDMIKGMDYESLDLDLVDEQSRKILGYVGKDEVVIYQDDPNQSHEKYQK